MSRAAHKPHTAPVGQDTPGAARSRIAGRPTKIEEQISERAYQLYLARGCGPGRALEDWLRAEVEVVRQRIETLPM